MQRFGNHFRQQFIGYVALFIALGGVSYAAVSLPGNSVGAKQLKNQAVTPPKVAPSTKALFRGQRGLAGATGPAGAQGSKGDTGAQGTPGANGINGINGINGADGTTVVARARMTGSPVTTTGSDIPLAGNSWTQGANEFDQAYGTANINVPAACVTGSGFVQLSLFEGSTRIGYFESIFGTPGTFDVKLFQTSGGAPLPVNYFEPGGSGAAHTLRVPATDACTSGHATVNSVKIDVLGAK